MTTKARTAPLDAAVAERLLDLLSTDDLFRERFQRDHLAALRSIGYESPDPAAMTACGLAVAAMPEPFRDCKVTQLAPKHVIAEARAEIHSLLTRGLAQDIPKLDARLGNEQRALKQSDEISGPAAH